MKHQFILRSLLACLVLLSLGACNSCRQDQSGDDFRNGHAVRTTQTFNLFPKESFGYDNKGKLSWDEAFLQSQHVVRTANLKQLDNANNRGAKPFYVYQVDAGSFEKLNASDKSKFPLLFLSKEQLFEGKVLRDSVYLFLAPIQKHQLLQNNMGVTYEWLTNSPFLIQEK